MQKRLELIARGEVQRVGYRSAVQALAWQGGITGTVENLPDGAVRIVCEGAAGALRGFRDGVRLREDYINVREIETVAEGEATGEFEYFRIVMGDMVEELKGSYDRGLRLLGEVKETIYTTSGETQAVIRATSGETQAVIRATSDEVKEAIYSTSGEVKEEIRGLGHELGGKLDAMHDDSVAFREQTHEDSVAFREQTHDEFSVLDEKYHTVSGELKAINRSIQEAVEIIKQALAER